MGCGRLVPTGSGESLADEEIAVDGLVPKAASNEDLVLTGADLRRTLLKRSSRMGRQSTVNTVTRSMTGNIVAPWKAAVSMKLQSALQGNDHPVLAVADQVVA